MSASLHHNLMAANTSRNLTSHYSRLSDSVRRLSTGLRVERAADDAAGLAIRELMRADMASLYQGARNINDAISLIQTADGALGVIDEKLIRMKELAEQAATGTYDSTQRLMIDSEFQQMASEIERIARATDFNGIHLLDGSLSGTHDGSGLTATGALKVHFGTANDSAEDYYYVEIGDATLKGLGLLDVVEGANGGNQNAGAGGGQGQANFWDGKISDIGFKIPDLYDDPTNSIIAASGTWEGIPGFVTHRPKDIQNWFNQQGTWYFPGSIMFPSTKPTFVIPKGTKNFALISYGGPKHTARGDNDIELFALKDMGTTYKLVQLAGTDINTDPAPDSLDIYNNGFLTEVFRQCYFDRKKVDTTTYDNSQLNTGPKQYDPSGNTVRFTNIMV